MRSIMSIYAEHYLRSTGYKKRVNDVNGMAAYLEERRLANKCPNEVPSSLKMKSPVDKKLINGMEVFYINKSSVRNNKQVLYLHGGGYIEQPVPEHWKFLDKLAGATGALITMPIYPKAPDYQYTDTFERLLSLYKSLLYDTDAKNIIFMGDSAGGGLALALAEYLLEKGLPQPGKLILLSPWLDITMENPDIPALDSKDPSLGIYGLIQMGKAWAGGTDPHNYMLSPVYGSVLGLGEITIIAGGHEVLLPDIRKFNALAEKQNVKINYYEYPKMNHVFPLFPIPEAKKAQRQIFDIIKS